MANATDAISEARANLANIDKEIDAAMEQITTLQAKVDNLRKTKQQDEALVRIVEMHAQGKDITALLNSVNSTRARQDRGDQARTVRGPRGNAALVVDGAREFLAKEGSATVKDIIKYLEGKQIAITGKDDEARQRNVYLALNKDGSGFVKDKGMFSLAD